MRLDLLLPEESPPARTCPLFLERVPCGFPSPAQDYVEADLDLNSHCVVHPAATFFFRVDSLSGEQPGMNTGDILVVDRSLTPAHDDTIVASVDGVSDQEAAPARQAFAAASLRSRGDALSGS
ncbi:S24 family peptidase [Pantoea sp. A4]|uniref:S24 family peptidase n=1 Tax=Pantoea sp. A4 TaxID=1225184 RepID=UPI000B1AF666